MKFHHEPSQSYNNLQPTFGIRLASEATLSTGKELNTITNILDTSVVQEWLIASNS